jgi:heptosyltransferase-2
VVNFHASPSSALLAYSTGARIRAVHFHELRKPRRYFSTVPIPNEGKLLPIIERDMDAVRALGLQAPAGLLPKLYFQPRELALASQHLMQLGLSGELLMIGLGASRPTKHWPLERFAETAIGWCLAKPAASALAIAGPDDPGAAGRFLLEVEKALSARIDSPEERQALRTRIQCVGNLNVRELGATLSQASVYLGNDSGPKHVAVAVGVPTVSVFGPEHPYEWHPYPQARHPYFFTESLSCRKDAQPGFPDWCGLSDCIVEKHRCMRGIGHESVLEACLKVAGK